MYNQSHSMRLKTSPKREERPGYETPSRVGKSFLVLIVYFLLSANRMVGTNALAALQDGSDFLYVCSSTNIGRTDDINVENPDWVDITPPGVGTIADCIPDPWQSEEKMWVVSSSGIWKGELLNTNAPIWTLLLSTDQIRSATDGHTQNGSAPDRIIASFSVPGTVLVLYSHGGLGDVDKTWVGRSIDDGLTWSWVLAANEGQQARPFGFAISQNGASVDELIIWATSLNNHLYKSNDGGQTFQRVVSLQKPSGYQLHAIYSPRVDNDGSVLYVGGGSGSRETAFISRTLDGGANWADISPVGEDSLQRGPHNQYEMAGAISSPFHLYALVQRAHDVVHENKKLYYSTDGGSSWSLRYDFASWGFDVVGIGINAFDENRLYVLREGLQSSATDILFQSDDGGMTWSNKSGNWKSNIGNWTLPVAVWDGSFGRVDWITQGSDDAGPDATNCSFSVSHNEIYLGQCASGEEIVSGFRFQNIPIASPGEIENAYIEFTVDGPYSNDIQVAFRGEDVDNSDTFSDANKPSDRQALTGSTVEWILHASDVWTVGEKRNSPDLAPVIKEIVTRPGWKMGNAISIIVKNVASNGNHRRVFASEREGAAKAARLIINKSQAPISIISPHPGDRWLVEEVQNIRWVSSPAVSEVRIEYSINNGADWQDIVASWPASSASYSWEIPNLTSSECKVRISSVSDPNISAESGVFTIKGWQLSRFVNGAYELFELGKHAWSFSNIDGIDFSVDPPDYTNAIMWPMSWWQDFDYTAPQYPKSWQFPPVSAKSSDFPDWPLFVDAFGVDQCYWKPPNGDVHYNSAAVNLWVATKQLFSGTFFGWKNSWNGSCAGFAISSFAAFDDKNAFQNKFPAIPNFANLHDLNINVDTRKAINQLWVQQFGKRQLLDFAEGYTKSPLTTLNEVKEMLLSDGRNNKYLVLWGLFTVSGIHAVNPYKVERDPNDPEKWYIYVYDNNAPADTDRKIIISKFLGLWRWEYPNLKFIGLPWGGDHGMYLMGPAIDYLETPELPLSINFPTSTVSNKSIAKESNESGESNAVVFYNTPNASVLITNSTGNTIGYTDSIAFNYMDKGIPIIPVTGGFHPPVGYFLPKDDYNIQLQHFTDSLAYLSVLEDSTIYSYACSHVVPDEREMISYGTDGFTMKNEDVRDKNIWLQLVIAESDNEKLFKIENCKVTESDSLRFHDLGRRQLYVDNHGSAKQYDLFVQLSSPSGASLFEHSAIPIPANATQTIVPEWDDLDNQPVKILVDDDLDGTIDDTLSIDNQVVDVRNDNPSVGFPSDFALIQNYPNPFNAITNIRFGIRQASKVKIILYNLRGQQLAILYDGWQPAGFHTLKFDASDLASGLYLYRMKTGEFNEVKKMILIK